MKNNSDKGKKKEAVTSKENQKAFPEQKQEESNKAGTIDKNNHPHEEKGSMKNSK